MERVESFPFCCPEYLESQTEQNQELLFIPYSVFHSAIQEWWSSIALQTPVRLSLKSFSKMFFFWKISSKIGYKLLYF